MTAQRTARLKDEFLATLSHELRSPLSAILGWTQILLKHDASIGAKELRRAIEVIDRNARAQVQLIDDLLDLSRIMTGKLRLDCSRSGCWMSSRAAIESAEPAAQAKDIRLKSILDPAANATVSADAGRLQQVVWNLLTNAIKFTPKGGRVQVLLQRVNSHIELSVSDTGIGIPPNFLPHVFDRFSQRDSSTTRSYGGLGLGLAISKQLVELHGGSIRVASQGEGKGATFFVHLPLSIVQLEDEPPSVSIPRRTAAPMTCHCRSSTAFMCSSSMTSPTRATSCGACWSRTKPPSTVHDSAQRRTERTEAHPTCSSATSGCRRWMATS